MPRNYSSKGAGPKKGGSRFGKSGGGRSYDRGSRDRDSDRPQMHPATCSMCHRDCQVPFYPNGSKPIFCSTCFDKNGGRESKRFNGMNSSSHRPTSSPSYSGGGDSGVAEQLKKINAKLDAILNQLDV